MQGEPEGEEPWPRTSRRRADQDGPREERILEVAVLKLEELPRRPWRTNNVFWGWEVEPRVVEESWRRRGDVRQNIGDVGGEGNFVSGRVVIN